MELKNTIVFREKPEDDLSQTLATGDRSTHKYSCWKLIVFGWGEKEESEHFCMFQKLNTWFVFGSWGERNARSELDEKKKNSCSVLDPLCFWLISAVLKFGQLQVLYFHSKFWRQISSWCDVWLCKLLHTANNAKKTFIVWSIIHDWAPKVPLVFDCLFTLNDECEDLHNNTIKLLWIIYDAQENISSPHFHSHIKPFGWHSCLRDQVRFFANFANQTGFLSAFRPSNRAIPKSRKIHHKVNTSTKKTVLPSLDDYEPKRLIVRRLEHEISIG